MKKFFIAIIPLLLLFSCNSDDSSGGNDGVDFSRKDLLSNIVNNYIEPAVKQYANDVEELNTAWNDYKANPTNASNLIEKYHNVQISFQGVEMLKIGTISQNDFTNHTSIYPVNNSEIEDKISQNDVFNATLPSHFRLKGLASLDYLFFGNGGLQSRISDESYRNYVSAVIDNLMMYSNQIEEKWTNQQYKSDFINNDGSGVNSSLDEFTNQLIYFYEKRLRAGKVGIPAGIFSSSNVQPNATETLYEEGRSKTLLLESLKYFEYLISGKGYNGIKQGTSLLDYADAVQAKSSNGVQLSTEITNQIQVAKEKIQLLNEDLSQQVINNNTELVKAYEELQELVPLLKMDLVQALGISIVYIDADGD